MMKTCLAWSIPLVACTLVAQGLAQEPAVYNNVTSRKLETILTGMDIKYKKVPAKKEGVDFYDLERGERVFRLHNYQGQDLWLDLSFTEKLTLADVNEWNTKARHSRAVLLKQPERTTVSLEAQLDCLGGITDDLIRQFINRFDGESKAFAKFATK